MDTGKLMTTCLLIVAVFILSCGVDSPLEAKKEDVESGTLDITLRFPDDASAKTVGESSQTIHVHAFAYMNNLFPYDNVKLTMQGKTARGTMKLPAGMPFRIKVIGFDNLYTINYMGYVDNVSIAPRSMSSAVVDMYKYGWVDIPGGTFEMGSADGGIDERPSHKVTVNSFYMTSTEVTQIQWTKVMPNVMIEDGYAIWVGGLQVNVPPVYMNSNPSYNDNDITGPLENVSWEDAAAFCNRLSDLDGLDLCYDTVTWECDFSKNGYRLPTEAEWEYVCRAGTTTKYYNGDDEAGLLSTAWFADTTFTTRPVAMLEPNPWGLYDMLGNVSEWCYDMYGKTYYTDCPETFPTGPEESQYRVNRGGGYTDDAGSCRSAKRFSYYPVMKSSRIGVRIVRNAQ